MITKGMLLDRGYEKYDDLDELYRKQTGETDYPWFNIMIYLKDGKYPLSAHADMRDKKRKYVFVELEINQRSTIDDVEEFFVNLNRFMNPI